MCCMAGLKKTVRLPSPSMAEMLASQTLSFSAGSKVTPPQVVPPSEERAIARQWQLLLPLVFGSFRMLMTTPPWPVSVIVDSSMCGKTAVGASL